jgi:DNA-binding NarL/FixJ family response regulator
MKKIRLLVIEEHNAVRNALETLLRSSLAIEVVTAVRDIGDGNAKLGQQHPDIVLLGLRTSSHRELSATVQAVQELSRRGAAVIVLTPYADDFERELVLQAGACCYLLKDINSHQLLAQIEAVTTANP